MILKYCFQPKREDADYHLKYCILQKRQGCLVQEGRKHTLPLNTYTTPGVKYGHRQIISIRG